MPAWASTPTTWTSCSTPSTQQKPTAWVSGSPSVAPSSRDIMDVSGRRQTTVPVPPSRFPFPAFRRPFRTRRRDEALMTDKRSLVSVVDDDESMRESLPDLLQLFGFAAESFSSAEAFLASDVVSETSCLLLDIAMPGMSGPDLQQELSRRRQKIPIVFITGLADESIRPRLLARGAVECLIKPFSEAALLDAVSAALCGHIPDR